MTVDEAIKDLQARIDGEFYIKGVDDCKDMKLGKKALKRLKELRRYSTQNPKWLIPGETE